MTTSAAPARRIAIVAPAITDGWVLMAAPARYSTRLGLSSTRLPRNVDVQLAHAAQHDVSQVGGIVGDGGEKHRRDRRPLKACGIVLPSSARRGGQRRSRQRGEEGAPVRPSKRRASSAGSSSAQSAIPVESTSADG